MPSTSFDPDLFLKHFFKSPEKGFKYLLQNNWNDSVYENLIQSVRKKISIDKMIQSWIDSDVPSQQFATFLEGSYHDKFKQIIKEKRLFNSTGFYPLVKYAYASDKRFIAELDFWRNLWKAMDFEVIQARKIIAKYNFEEILMLCGLYYDKLRISIGVSKNQDADLIETINLILNEKLRIRKPGSGLKSHFTPESFRDRNMELLAHLIKSGDSDIQNLFVVFDKKAELQFLYEYYCFHSFQFNLLSERSAVLRPENEEQYLKYKKAGGRYEIWHSFYHNVVFYEFDDLTENIEGSEMSWYNKLSHYRTWEQYYQFIDSGFTAEVYSAKGAVDSLKCFQVINSISSWSNIRWNNFIETEILHNNRTNPYEIILRIIAHNIRQYDNDVMPVFFRSYSDLTQTASEINHFDFDESDRSLSLFTNNLNYAEYDTIDLSQKPFIKIDQNLYWIAGIMANKNYSVMLHNMMSAQDRMAVEKGARATYAVNAEAQLCKWFEQNKYSCKPNYDCYLDVEKKNKSGEIDLLAYKNKTLFICQVKSTFHRSTITDVHQHFSDERSGIAKAKFQLTRDVGFIKSKWHQLSQILGADCTLDELEIVPLAVTTTLEPGDGSFQIGDVIGYVVPLFELRVILTNSKFYLYNISEMALRKKFGKNIPVEYLQPLYGMQDRLDIAEQISNFVLEYVETEKPRFSLWADGHKLCEPDDLIHAIKNESVWDMLSEPMPLGVNAMSFSDIVLNYVR